MNRAKSLSVFLVGLGSFITGVVIGFTATIIVDWRHDERVRREVWQTAIDRGIVCPECCENATNFAKSMDLKVPSLKQRSAVTAPLLPR
jgi:hypothetical protein